MKGLLVRCVRGPTPVLALFALALGLRLANMAFGSLKLDDFHSLHHARASGLGPFLRVLVEDNHPPLGFALLAASRSIFGESAWALRLPALLAGLGTLLLVWRMGARLPGPAARFAATWLVATSTLHIELSTDVRMYSLLALASAGLLDALWTRLEEGRGAGRIALWTVVGLHAHYHFLYVLAALGGATLLLALTRPVYRAALRPCLGDFGLAGLLSAPWYLAGFPLQLAHGLAPGGSDASALRFLEGLKNLVFLNVSVAGEALRVLGLAASALLLALAAWAALSELGRARTARRPAGAVLLLAAALGVPLLAWCGARASARAGYEWRYLLGALPAFSLLVGAQADAAGRLRALRRVMLLVVGGSALPLAIANARDPGEEDYRGAIAWITERAMPDDAVVAADWQPRLFPHGIAWHYYAPLLAGAQAPPVELAYTDDFALVEPALLEHHGRIFCCLRSLPAQCALLQALRRTHAAEETRVFGRSVYVHVFTRP